MALLEADDDFPHRAGAFIRECVVPALGVGRVIGLREFDAAFDAALPVSAAASLNTNNFRAFFAQ